MDRALTNKSEPRIYTQGGWGQYGRNSTLLVYENEGLMLDCGVNVSALIAKNKAEMYPFFYKRILDKIKLQGVLLSHAHLDHIGAIPVFNKYMPTVYYGTPFTVQVCKNLGYNAEYVEITQSSIFTLGVFTIKSVSVQHSIPGAVFYVISVGSKTICYASDFKLDFRPVLGEPTDLTKLKEDLGAIDYFIFDTTRAYSKLRTKSETYIGGLLEEELHYATYAYRNVIYACYASHISRIKKIIEVANNIGYKIYILGRSFKIYLNAARDAGIFNLPPGVVMLDKNYKGLLENISGPRHLLLMSGVNGEENAVLTRLTNDQFKYDNIIDDVVLVGGHEIPSSKYSRLAVVNRLIERGVNVDEIHASGHSSLSDLLLLFKTIKPRILLPTHSNLATVGVLVDALGAYGYSLTKGKNRIYILGSCEQFTCR